MALSPFTRELGISQGRIAPNGWTPPSGDFVFVLGSDRAGQKVLLGAGDSIKVAQTSGAGTGKLIRARLKTRSPGEAPPGGVTWSAAVVVNSVTVVSLDMTEAREYADVAANVSAIVGSFPIEFRLSVAGGSLPAELELPAFYVDAIVLDDTTSRPLLANRFPAPGDVDVRRSTTIAVDVMDTTASGINLAATKVYVAGVLAFDAGSFQSGWSGAGSQTSSLDSGRTRRVVIDPQFDFLSEDLVEVRVVSATNDGAAIDETYSFTVEDFTPPVVVGALAVEETKVRVTFDEPIKQSAAADSDDALNPDNWAIISAGSKPAVWVVVTGVAAISQTTVELTTDIPLTAKAPYRVTAQAIVDKDGNVVAAPNNAWLFTAAGDQVIGRSFQIEDLLPAQNFEEDETGDLQRFIWIIQEVTDLLLRRIDRWSDIVDIDLAPEIFVDAILQDLGNPFSFVLTLNEKRKLAHLLVPIYRSKGLARGIKSAIRLFMGIEVTLRYPYFSGARLGRAKLGGSGPTPGTFILAGSAYDAYSYEVVSPRAVSALERDRITAIATYMQVAHEHLVRIVEPAPPPTEPDHMVLGLSKLGRNWRLH